MGFRGLHYIIAFYIILYPCTYNISKEKSPLKKAIEYDKRYKDEMEQFVDLPIEGYKVCVYFITF